MVAHGFRYVLHLEEAATPDACQCVADVPGTPRPAPRSGSENALCSKLTGSRSASGSACSFSRVVSGFVTGIRLRGDTFRLASFATRTMTP